jgi:glutathione peroxidase
VTKTIVSCATVAVGLLLASSCREEPVAPSSGSASMSAADSVPEHDSVYSFTLEDIDGHPTALKDFRGKVLLLVNVASKCGYTKQYEGLQALYDKYRDRGLVVLAFPANNFGGQEPGTNEQIKQFCSATYGVTFPVFAKISVRGDDIHPLYRFLTNPQSNPRYAGDIAWNFTKFLVGRKGDLIGRYESAVDPLDGRLVTDVEAALE